MQIFSLQSGGLWTKMLFGINIMCFVIVFLPKCCKFALFVRLRAVCLRVYGILSWKLKKQ